MYAVIVSGGKQHKVAPGETLKVEKLEAEIGSKVDFPVLMVANGEQLHIGAPIVENGKVVAEIVGHGRADKVKIIKFRRRKHFRKQQGHRQWFTEIKITDIGLA